jgi:hypothetical protein
MTDQTDPTAGPASEEPTEEVPVLPASLPPPPAPVAVPRARGPHLGHVVLGAVLVLIGIGWLLEALDITDVPWRFLLPSVLILVGLALTLGARTGSHGGLIAVGVILTMLVLAAGAIEVLMDVPLAGGVGDESLTPASLESEYRWGVGKMTLDLTQAQSPAGEAVSASVVIGELLVIVPDGVSLVIDARAGLGEVNILGTSADGVDPSLECAGTSRDLACGAEATRGERVLVLELEVAMGRVEVRR